LLRSRFGRRLLLLFLVCSLLPMTERQEVASPESTYVAEESVRLARLDSLELVQPDDRVYLKIDVQGAEGAVLDVTPALPFRTTAKAPPVTGSTTH
jgi:hypothetical protein